MLPDGKTERSLGYKLAVDTQVAALAGFTLAWLITPMDQAVMEKMSGKTLLLPSLKQSAKQIFKTPIQYARSPQFGYVFGTYTGTYLAKNYIDTLCTQTQQSNEATALYKFWGVFAVNGGLSVFWKDPGLARLFGKPSVKLGMPTYACWTGRDCLHMLGAVVLPDYLEIRLGWTKDQWRASQVAFPLIVQLVTTPLHLMGLDYANEPASPFRNRFSRVCKNWLPAAGLRALRMFPPWSLGLLINRDVREWLLE
jgi:hypothetical protein